MEITESSMSKPEPAAKSHKHPEPLIVFEVADVAQADEPLSEVPYPDAVKALLEKPAFEWPSEEEEDLLNLSDSPQRRIEACSQYRGQLVSHVYFHPVVAAIDDAYNQHRPLCLSPDIVWLLISQGLANHINANAEQLRHKFVKHKGKATIKVRRDDFVKGSPENPWPEVFGEFSASIREHIGEATHALIVPNFSTTGPVERAAGEIVLMDAMQSYFDYMLVSKCGIPKIKLEGTVADWEELLKRAKKLAKFRLRWWVKRLVPILKQFIAAAKGQPDKKFWQSMYKLSNPGSGTRYTTGWIINFFPYLKDTETRKATVKNNWQIQYGIRKLTAKDFPSGLASVPFCWNYLSVDYKMEFLAGFVGVRQDPDDLSLRPEIGWVVREAPTA